MTQTQTPSISAPADLDDSKVERKAKKAERSKPFKALVRLGFWARGITYGVIGALALGIAFGAGTDGTTPNQQGALALIGRSSLGRVTLIVIAVGLLAYAIWKFTQAFMGRGPEGGGDDGVATRVVNFAGGIVYVLFAAVAIRALSGSARGSSSQPRHEAAGVLGWPGGTVIVAIAGGALIAISLYQAYYALSGQFARNSKTGEMEAGERKAFMALGRIGLTSRAVVFALIGYFLLRTAIEFNPHSAVGVDGALARLHHEPLGPWLVGLAGVGLITFAVFSLHEGARRRL